MGIFKHRNLALGCFGFLIALYFSYSLCTSLLNVLFILPVALIIFGVISYLVFKKRAIKDYVIKYTPLCLFLSLAFIASILSFKNDSSNITYYCDGNVKETEMEIYEVRYLQDDLGIYLADVYKIDGENAKARILLITQDKELEEGDYLKASGTFLPLEEKSLGFSEKDTYLEYGVTMSLEPDSYEFIENREGPFASFFKNINRTLNKRFKNNVNSTTSPVLSALFLGNRESLDDSVSRDFSRIGISHILSLSGMHLAILVGILELFINRLKLNKIVRYLVLVSIILGYILVTGLALSCLRAGLMIIIVYTIELFFAHLNRLSSLFISVFIICVISPYAIFSSSLQLSFLAMLGCFISARVIHKGRLKHLRGRGKRYVIFTLITSMFVIFFTLPVIASQFGIVSLLSPFANIILVPIFSLLIYLAPLALIACDIPFLGDFIIFITEKITDGALFLVSSFSKIERAMLPIRNITQIIGVTVVSVSMIAILFLSKKHLKKIFVSSLVGAFIIFLGSCQLFIERGNSSYVGIYSFTGNDLVFYEENNTLTIVDITKCTKTSASRSRNLASYLGYSEIENYVITSFSENAIIHLNRLLNQTKIKHLYLPTPNTDTEIRLYYKIVELVISKDVIPKSINDEISILNSKMSFEITYHERSIRKSVSMLLEKGGTYFAYMSSGSFEVDSDFCKNSANLSSYLIFGSFGPSNRVTIDYEVPNLQYCAFLGDTPSYISTDFVIKNAKKTILYEKEPLKFTLP